MSGPSSGGPWVIRGLLLRVDARASSLPKNVLTGRGMISRGAYLSFVSVAVIRYSDKSNSGEKGFL